MKLFRIFFVSIVILGSLACAESYDTRPSREDSLIRSEMWKLDNASCQVKGNSANWQAAYCMWMNKTNDFSLDEVQACYKTLSQRQGIPQDLCSRNEFFKKEICKTLVLDHIFPGSLGECLASDDSVPRVVREGLEQP